MWSGIPPERGPFEHRGLGLLGLLGLLGMTVIDNCGPLSTGPTWW
ncbi:hypothetical protein SBD_8010 [Streptomyces bottropensis ATCC 25435]|uniref:Uncharacterized protein n=1 Tax=Streptomyces bottropensis ATCC 25435 TaxID=1054862 RepID=M3E4A5_9ACTN|nr:hypothetical protein SBD_8010 [Streptomyces bottropensis ATCC 25435]